MSLTFVLFEHATGYAIFRVQEFEEVGMLLPQVEKSVQDLKKFNSVVKLEAFYPFKNAANALDNANSVSEGVLHEDLVLFLETNLPKPKKSTKVILGVGDAKIGAAISESLGVQCQHVGVFPEIIRGIRHHFPGLVRGLTIASAGKAQLGLGHSYSRAKVKFNVNRVDNMIIQSISLLDQLDKDINTFSMRIREWYSYHFPELVKIVPENYMYARVVKVVKNRKELTEENFQELEDIVMDSDKVQAIFDASKSSMGMDISPIDLLNIETFAARVISLNEYRKSLQEYLKNKMTAVAPNLATLIGDQVGARLISRAGSLTNLAKYPASTVQILGAEKALFRALKSRSNTPKYGLLYYSTFIGRAATANKGRISRYLANKCSIASRIDCFSEGSSKIFGEKLKSQVEERLLFYEKGTIPRKNLEVMQEAIQEVKLAKKKKKKAKKEKREQEPEAQENGQGEGDEPVKKKKKAKKMKREEMEMNASNSSIANYEPPKKKKKNR